MPDIVYGISEMTFFITIHDLTGLLEPGLGTMIIAHVSFQVPFVALLVYSRLVGLDPTLFEATQDLYATPLQRAWHFILPVLRPAVISAFFLAFTLSIDDFVISFFTAGPESTTLPIFIWSAIKKGITPEINAISTLMILAVFTAAVISFAIQRVRPAR
jgi:spermidine/putrescine transport system permease protein